MSRSILCIHIYFKVINICVYKVYTGHLEKTGVDVCYEDLCMDFKNFGIKINLFFNSFSQKLVEVLTAYKHKNCMKLVYIHYYILFLYDVLGLFFSLKACEIKNFEVMNECRHLLFCLFLHFHLWFLLLKTHRC